MIHENDLVLIYVDEKPGFYARVEEIVPDERPGWWLTRLLVLTFPLQVFNWILDEYQLDEAPFTMDKTPLRIEKLHSPLKQKGLPDEGRAEYNPEQKKSPPVDAGQKVVSLAERRRKK